MGVDREPGGYATIDERFGSGAVGGGCRRVVPPTNLQLTRPDEAYLLGKTHGPASES
jgi:hypothetical protein